MIIYRFLFVIAFVWTGFNCSDNAVTNLPENKNPLIKELKSVPDSVGFGGRCTISCITINPQNDSITYIWNASAGRITKYGSSIEWLAPAVKGVYTINCKITGDTGLPDSSSVNVKVFDDRILYYSASQKIYLAAEGIYSPEYITTGGYPFWLEGKSKIGIHSKLNQVLYILDGESKEIISTYDITGYGTCTFGRYSPVTDKFLFAVNYHGHRSIAVMDRSGKFEIITRQYEITGPVSSGSDDWIYYLNNSNGNWDIFRMKFDGSNDESITDSQDYEYRNISLSYDGNFLVSSKVKEGFTGLAIIDTRTKSERVLDLSDLGFSDYPSFSYDNKFIFFTGGYDKFIYRINFDGANRKAMVIGNEQYYRPLDW